MDLFQHDNARPHTARVGIDYLQNAVINVMDWPAESPNLSPIENMWAHLGDKVKKRQVQPATQGELVTIYTKTQDMMGPW